MRWGPTVAIALLLCAACSAQVNVYVAYYDNEHPNALVPDPWRGSPNTVFFGGTDSTGVLDAGAIRFENPGPNPVILGAGLRVDGFANGASFRLWDGFIGTSLLIAPGANLIFTQPTTGAFDTSDQPIINDPVNRTKNRPVVHFTIDGQPYAFTDATQVLNTGGFDPGEAEHISESLPWTRVGVVPEPSAFAVSCAGVLLVRKRI